jgi:hypothetical protein
MSAWVENLACSKREQRKLHERVREEYKAYEDDKFSISRSASYLFESRTMMQHMNQDNDGIRCWLADVQLGKTSQEEFRKCLADVAKPFFRPRSRLEVKSQHEMSTLVEDNSIETKTYSMPARSDLSSVGSSWGAGLTVVEDTLEGWSDLDSIGNETLSTVTYTIPSREWRAVP